MGWTLHYWLFRGLCRVWPSKSCPFFQRWYSQDFWLKRWHFCQYFIDNPRLGNQRHWFYWQLQIQLCYPRKPSRIYQVIQLRAWLFGKSKALLIIDYFCCSIKIERSVWKVSCGKSIGDVINKLFQSLVVVFSPEGLSGDNFSVFQ